MFRYFADERTYAARERKSGRTGELFLATVIDIRGNPSKGPVLVKLKYAASFRQDSWRRNARRHRRWREFQSESDRQCFIDTFYEVESMNVVRGASAKVVKIHSTDSLGSDMVAAVRGWLGRFF